MNRLSALFPSLPEQFFLALTDLVQREAMTYNRLKDAIDNAARTCKYSMPTASEILGYDRKVKLLTYNEYCDKINDGYQAKDFETITTPHGKRWAMKSL